MLRFLPLLFLLASLIAPASAQVPRWTGPDRSGALESLVAAVRDADLHGLRSEDYRLADLERIDAGVASAAADRFADRVFLALADDLLTGRLDPLAIDPDWPFPPRTADIAALRLMALESGDTAAVLNVLSPRDPDYRALQAALAHWQSESDVDWPPIEYAGAPMTVGDSGPAVRSARRRLLRLGWFAPRSRVEPLPETLFDFGNLATRPDFDQAMAEAVSHMQRSARLEPDGVVGPDTLAWLNRLPSDRVATIRANLERLRWIPEDLGAAHIAVNIPDFTLQAVENGTVVRRHNVIVGRVSRASPILSASLSHVIVNPWWETPHSLAVRDELPLFRRDPGAVARLGFQVLDRENNIVDAAAIDWSAVNAADFPYRLRQAPGPLNALGVVKLIFPNPHNAYLHDTPGRHRFAELPRAFSSGCVRVEDAVALAEWAMQFAADDPDRQPIANLVAAGSETRIDITADVQVHFLYLTAMSGGPSSVRMVNDLYQRDHTIFEALDAPRDLPEIRPAGTGPLHPAAPRHGNGYPAACAG